LLARSEMRGAPENASIIGIFARRRLEQMYSSDHCALQQNSAMHNVQTYCVAALFRAFTRGAAFCHQPTLPYGI